MSIPATWRTWPIWARFLTGALLLYAALLCAVSLSVFISALRQRDLPLKPADIAVQTLMTCFLPLVIFGLWKPRLASLLLLIAVAADIALLFSLGRSTGDGTTVMIAGSLLFLGTPMLAAAILFRSLSRPIKPTRLIP